MHQNDDLDDELKAMQGHLTEERRKNTELLYTMIAEIKTIMRDHIKEENGLAQETNQLLRDFISGLDAITHKQHHHYVGEKMEEEKTSNEFKSKMKATIANYLVIMLISAVVGGIGVVLTSYFWTATSEIHDKIEAQKSGK